MPFSPDLPDPPVPADCDLRSYAFYPLFLDRLLGSWFHRCATPVEWRAGLLLWMKSWREVPAGSLPADDRELAALAELPMRTWLKVKPVSLHGWVLHSDGRLYHPVVTEVTVRAQTQRQGFVARGRAGAEARWGNSSEHSSKHARADGSKHGSEDSSKNGNIRKKEGSDTPSSSDANASEQDCVSGEAVASPIPEPFDPTKDLWDRGLLILGKKHRSLLGKLVSQYGKPAVLGAIVACEREQPVDPVAFFVEACERRRRNGPADPARAYDILARAAIEYDERASRSGPPEALD